MENSEGVFKNGYMNHTHFEYAPKECMVQKKSRAKMGVTNIY